jgi:hypothetical protein
MIPQSIRLRMYQVGFGDCFLLTFQYEDGNRHLLIDFGTVAMPKDQPKVTLAAIAKSIQETVKKEPFSVVATHRHADHICGFDPGSDGKGTGAVIAALKPQFVVQPWTEQLNLATDAKEPKALVGGRAHRQTLEGMQALARRVLDVDFVRLKRSQGTSALVNELAFIGEDNVSNPGAVNNLAKMGKKAEYLYFGKKTQLERFLPGVKVHVLGPPTLKQHEAIKGQRQKDPNEFWNLKLRALGLASDQVRAASKGLLPKKWEHTTGGTAPPWARWIVKALRRAHGEQTLELVRTLDKAMNNTSLILLFECGDLKLLFPGDAQIENWEYALSQSDVLKLLRGVSVYKVGHHGSTNATPKTLWKNWFPDGAKAKAKADRMAAFMSTMPTGKYPSVPKDKLVTALNQWTRLTTTNGYEDGLYVEQTFAPT